MTKEFSYNVEKMKSIASDVKAVSEDLQTLNSTIQNAKASISGMNSLGFLETKHARMETIEANILNSIKPSIDDYHQMIVQNASDVSGTDNKLAEQIEGACK